MILERYHDISCGHRVLGHKTREGKPGPCSRAHGHNYRVYFRCTAIEMNNLGMVIDFSEVKYRLCQWLEDNWDHRMLLSKKDPWIPIFRKLDKSLVILDFNPTVENLCKYLVEIVGPKQLKGTGITLHSCKIDETRKCSATYSL